MKTTIEQLEQLRNDLIKIGQIAPDIKDQIKKTIDIVTQLEFFVREYDIEKTYFDFKSCIKYTPDVTKKENVFLMNQKSYLSKNKFMEILSKLNFIAIEKAQLHFITDFVNKINDKNEYITLTRGFDFDIY